MPLHIMKRPSDVQTLPLRGHHRVHRAATIPEASAMTTIIRKTSGKISGRRADRGQPHDAGRVAGSLACGIQGRHDSAGDAGRLPELYRKLHQAAAWRQTGFAHHDAGRAADVPAAEIRRARARGRGGQQAPLRLDRAAHPHDAARRDEGCGAGAHHSEKSDRERNCTKVQTTSRCRC